MIKNRLIAVIFRFAATGVIAAGLLLGSGITGGPLRLLSYTGQSNMLCAVFIFFTAIRTLFDLLKNGINGSACYYPRLAAGVLITIFFTMFIFWSVLAPFAYGQNLWTAGNLILHAVSPLLMAADHLCFCESGKLKKNDAWFFALIPSVYILESVVLGFCGVVFYVKDGVNYYFPYLFMDFYVLGWLAALCIAVIASAFVGVSYILLFFDRKWKKPVLYLRRIHQYYNIKKR